MARRAALNYGVIVRVLPRQPPEPATLWVAGDGVYRII